VGQRCVSDIAVGDYAAGKRGRTRPARVVSSSAKSWLCTSGVVDRRGPILRSGGTRRIDKDFDGLQEACAADSPTYREAWDPRSRAGSERAGLAAQQRYVTVPESFDAAAPVSSPSTRRAPRLLQKLTGWKEYRQACRLRRILVDTAGDRGGAAHCPGDVLWSFDVGGGAPTIFQRLTPPSATAARARADVLRWETTFCSWSMATTGYGPRARGAGQVIGAGQGSTDGRCRSSPTRAARQKRSRSVRARRALGGADGDGPKGARSSATACAPS